MKTINICVSFKSIDPVRMQSKVEFDGNILSFQMRALHSLRFCASFRGGFSHFEWSSSQSPGAPIAASTISRVGGPKGIDSIGHYWQEQAANNEIFGRVRRKTQRPGGKSH